MEKKKEKVKRKSKESSRKKGNSEVDRNVFHQYYLKRKGIQRIRNVLNEGIESETEKISTKKEFEK